jgi:putative radical SAM enzyme (TIGR03279 family)
MMKNKSAGAIMDQLRKIVENDLDVNCQIVICPGVNDGAALEKTLEDLMSLGDRIRSIALVPVGLTKFRDENGLDFLKPMLQSDAINIARKVNDWQEKFLTLRGERTVYAADEIYIKAGIAFPPLKEYDDLPQLENGVGMVPMFVSDMQKGLRKRLKRQTLNNSSNTTNKEGISKNILLITGADAKDYLSAFEEQLSLVYSREFTIMAIPNLFFGQTVTVAGLVTGNDILRAVNDQDESDKYEIMVIPRCMLRSGETVFLDDMSIDELHKKTKIKILTTESDGKSFLKTLDDYFFIG